MSYCLASSYSSNRISAVVVDESPRPTCFDWPEVNLDTPSYCRGQRVVCFCECHVSCTCMNLWLKGGKESGDVIAGHVQRHNLELRLCSISFYGCLPSFICKTLQLLTAY